MMIIPCLDFMMQQKNVTAEDLALHTGLSQETIKNARKLKPIRVINGLIILQTLKERTFGYKNIRGLNRLKNGPYSKETFVHQRGCLAASIR